MSFVNFSNFEAPKTSKINKQALVEALLKYETKDPKRAERLVEGLESEVDFSTAASLFSNKLHALAVLRIVESNKKPGPDPYMTGLDDETEEEKEEQMKKQAEMDDDDPAAYKEMPGDKEAREKGKVKTSKHTKAYDELYGDDEENEAKITISKEDMEKLHKDGKVEIDGNTIEFMGESVELKWDALIEKINNIDVSATNEAKKKWYKDRGEWEDARNRLDIADDTDSKSIDTKGKTVALWYDDRDEGWVYEAGINDPVLMAFRAAKMKREKELAKPKRKPLYGKQREKAEDELWRISQYLKDLYAERGQLLIDMEEEAEPEGGPIADRYGEKLNRAEEEIQRLIAKRNTLEIRLAESFETIEDLDEARSIGKIQKDWAKVTADMKTTVDSWKSAEGKEKEDLLAKLKDLTASKKKLEVELDKAVGLQDADAELVGEAKVDLWSEIEAEFTGIYSKLNDLAEETTDSKWRKALQGIISGLDAVESKIGQASNKLGVVPTYESVSEAANSEIEKKVQKFVIKNANDYDYSNQESAFQIYLALKKLYPRLIKESVSEADFGKPSNGDYSDEMSFGQLERCIDYSTMIRERIEAGTSLDPWMHSQIAVAENELNSVFDALDGDDGVVEARAVKRFDKKLIDHKFQPHQEGALRTIYKGVTQNVDMEVSEKWIEMKGLRDLPEDYRGQHLGRFFELKKNLYLWATDMEDAKTGRPARDSRGDAFFNVMAIFTMDGDEILTLWERPSNLPVATHGGSGVGFQYESVTNETTVNEWGGSDQYAMNQSIHRDMGKPKKMPSPFDNKLRSIAADAVDFYWDEWPEYRTNYDGLVDNAIRSYLRAFFKNEFDMMVRMFEPMESANITVESSEINEAKKLDRDEMMEWLENYLDFVRTTEEFDGAKGGIWTSGENGEEYKGRRIFNYYNDDYKKYEFGVYKPFAKELEKRGWYAEWYDAGTMMIWPI